MGRCFGGIRDVGKPRSRWEHALWRDAVDSLKIQNWKATGKKRKCWRKEIGEAMARKWAEVDGNSI
jgi:hypothetical protein